MRTNSPIAQELLTGGVAAEGRILYHRGHDATEA
jgi:hypothetical protein